LLLSFKEYATKVQLILKKKKLTPPLVLKGPPPPPPGGGGASCKSDFFDEIYLIFVGGRLQNART